MRPHAFWQLADRLTVNEKNPEGFRSAISRAYYAAFLAAVEFLGAMNISLLRSPGKHVELLTILGNTGDADIVIAGDILNRLRDQRNAADYDLADRSVENEANARVLLTDAYDVIAKLNRCRLDAARFAAVTVSTRAWVKKLRGMP